MKPQKLNVKGMIGLSRRLKLSEVELDLSTLKGIVALVGANGSGKTTVLECLQPWRLMPSRKIGLKEAVELRSSHKDLTFTWNGQTVRSLVTVDAQTGKSDGYLWIDGVSKVNNGLVSEHDEQLEALIGPADVFFHSVFAGQMVESLFSATYRPAKRKEFFVEFLGLGKLQEFSERAKSVAGFLAGRIDSSNESLKSVQQQTANADKIQQELIHVQLQKGSLASKVQECVAHAQAMKTKLRDLELSAVDLTATRDELERIRRRRQDHETKSQRSISEQRRKTEGLQRRVFTIEQELGRIEDKLKRAVPLRSIEELTTELQAAETTLSDLETEAQRQTEIRFQLQELTRRVDTATAVMNSQKKTSLELERLTEKIPSSADRLICSSCGFAEAALAAPAQRASAEMTLAQVQAECAPQIQTLRDQVKEVTPSQIAEMKRLVKERRAGIQFLNDRESERLTALHQQESLVELRSNLRESIDLDKQLEQENQEALIRFSTEEKEQQSKIDANSEVAKAIEQQAFRTEAADRELSSTQGQLAVATTREAELTTRQAVMREMMQQAVVIEDRIAQLDRDRSEWVFLQQLCGRDKLQALELDAAAPAITSFGNQLLAECFGGRFLMNFQTIDEAGREIFDLIVTDTANGRTESLLLKSGGEKVIVLHALRLAIALYGKERAGRNFETLYLDESEAALAPETRREFAGMLRAAMRLGGFSLALVVTHSTEVSDCADHIVSFENGAIQIR